MDAEPREEGQPVTKIMSISQREFARLIGRMYQPAADPDWSSRYEVPSGTGCVSIHFEQLAPQVLGGLLSLPRARVTLNFKGLTAIDRANFLARFDLTFHRGGG